MSTPSPLLLFHTADSQVAFFGELLAELAPGVPARHLVRADLLDEAIAAGELGPALRRKASAALLAAAAEAPLLLCTCSTLGPAADDAASAAAVPVLRIDRPMAEAAVRSGDRILVAACLQTTLEPTTALLAATARELGRAPQITTLLMADAWQHFRAGDRVSYLDEIAAGLTAAAGSVDVIVLAQASMAGAVGRCGALAAPVLTSPRSGLEAALARYRSLGSPHPLVLASASARRRAFLTELGLPFEVRAAEIDERRRPGEAAADMALRLAREKASSVARAIPGRWVLAADTVVVVDDEILGKPRDRDDARRMLRRLAARSHLVITGVVLSAPDGREELAEAVTTDVVFRALTPAEIDAYLDTGEADDKAGAYGIQGAAGAFVVRVDGSYSNVVGLPLEIVEPALRRTQT